MDFKIRAFKAVDDPETCLKYMEAHRTVLKDYGITNITTNTDEWKYNPNIYCIVVELFPENTIVGGIRVQISDHNHKLPLEMAIGKMDNGIYKLISDLRIDGGVGELCALWNAKSVAGMGLSVFLVRSAIAIASQLPITTLICICADYTLKMFQKVGFRINDNIGVRGSFPYPNENYTARVLGIMNPHSLNTADPDDRSRIESLRLDPLQTFFETGNNAQIKIKYNLVFVK